jgi:hypothetical protein
MFNFLSKKTQQQSPENQKLASVSYVMDASGRIIVDIAMQDYSDECMTAIFEILEMLADENALSETLNILKHNLVKHNQTELVQRLENYVTLKSNNKKILKIYENIINSQPCIKPSDIMK